MLNAEPRRLEVWGDPVAHSRSPQLHSAAYRVLGLDWTYERRQVTEERFTRELGGLSPEFRGLSLTMPLKGAAFAAARTRDRRADLTGAVNTLLLEPGGPVGFNTDVGGLVRALREERWDAAGAARIIGAGATATSALVALAELGVDRVEVVARRPEAVDPLIVLGDELGLPVSSAAFIAARSPVDLTIATLPGDAAVSSDAADALAAGGGPLMDVVYGHWPTPVSEAWERAGAPARSGLGMLLHQALLQVRVFVLGDPDRELPDEAAVLAEMRLAVMGD